MVRQGGARRILISEVSQSAESAVSGRAPGRPGDVEILARSAHHIGGTGSPVILVAGAIGCVLGFGVVAVCHGTRVLIGALGRREEVDGRDVRVVGVRAELLVGEEGLNSVGGRGLLLDVGLGALGGGRAARFPYRGSRVLLWRLALALVQFRDNAVAQLIQVNPVTGVTSLAVAVDSTRAGRVGDAELIGV